MDMNEIEMKIITYDGDEWSIDKDNNLWGI